MRDRPEPDVGVLLPNGVMHTPSDPQHTSVATEELVDSLTMRACFTNVKGEAVVIFEFTSTVPGPNGEVMGYPPIHFVSRPDTFRKLGIVIRDTCNRAANLAEGKR